jgi:hypothetical protein
VEESIANKISISNKILGIGENQPSTSSTSRAANEMGTSSQPNPHSLKYQTLYRRLLLKIVPTVKWMYNRGHPKVNDSLRKFPYFSLD